MLHLHREVEVAGLYNVHEELGKWGRRNRGQAAEIRVVTGMDAQPFSGTTTADQ